MSVGWTRIRWLLLLPVAACAVAALVVLYRVDPSQSTRYPKCAFYWLTGLHCPGCGSTRALHALLHGQLLEALRFNALLIVGVPCVLLFAFWRQRFGIGHVKMAWLSGAIALVVVAFGIARNIPCHPFELLAPHGADTPLRKGTGASRAQGPKADGRTGVVVSARRPAG